MTCKSFKFICTHTMPQIKVRSQLLAQDLIFQDFVNPQKRKYWVPQKVFQGFLNLVFLSGIIQLWRHDGAVGKVTFQQESCRITPWPGTFLILYGFPLPQHCPYSGQNIHVRLIGKFFLGVNGCLYVNRLEISSSCSILKGTKIGTCYTKNVDKENRWIDEIFHFCVQ